MRTFFRLVPILLLLLAAPPVHAQEARDAQGEEAPPRIDPSHPVHGLSGPILMVLRQMGMRDPRGHFVLMTDSGGSSPRIRFAGAEVPDGAHPAIARVVASFLAHQPSREPIALSFRLDGPANAELERLPPEPGAAETPPEQANRSMVRQLMEGILRAHPGAERLVRANAALLLLVDSNGDVSYVVLRDRTGDPNIDYYLMSLGYDIRFRPARRNGDPVNAWVGMRLVFGGGRYWDNPDPVRHPGW